MIFKKLDWHILPEYKDTAFGKALKNFDDAYRYEGHYISGRVYKINIDNKNYYLKKFVKRKKLWVRFLSFSKILAEYNNLALFYKLGIPAAKVAAYGQETIAWVVQRGLLITEELSGCHDLVEIVETFPHLLQQTDWLEKVSHQVADATRKMHQYQFAHSDLKWRNIMVDTKSDFPQIYLIDCPAGMRWYRPLLEYRIIKDLACLDKRAKYELSKKQRLAFYKDYAQCQKLTAKDKKRIRKILQFFYNRE